MMDALNDIEKSRVKLDSDSEEILSYLHLFILLCGISRRGSTRLMIFRVNFKKFNYN
jgi:hypothetical protein